MHALIACALLLVLFRFAVFCCLPLKLQFSQVVLVVKLWEVCLGWPAFNDAIYMNILQMMKELSCCLDNNKRNYRKWIESWRQMYNTGDRAFMLFMFVWANHYTQGRHAADSCIDRLERFRRRQYLLKLTLLRAYQPYLSQHNLCTLTLQYLM